MDLIVRVMGWFRANLGAIAWRLLVALLIVLAAVILARVLSSAVQRALHPGRAQALAPALRGLVRLCVIGAGIVTALDQIGINIATVLAGAGVAGLAVGFGAQTLVKDVIAGFFIIFDEVLKPGDLARVGDAYGVVEAVGLRGMQIRGSEGQLWFIPNGQVSVVANFSRGWTRAVVQVLISYEQDLRKALHALQQAGNDFAKMHADLVLEPPEAQGILAAGPDVGIRLVVKVKADDRSEIERKLRQVIKERFDAEGVKFKLG